MGLHVVLAILIILITLCVYVFKCSWVCLSCDQSHDMNQEVDQYKASSMSNNQGDGPNHCTRWIVELFQDLPFQNFTHLGESVDCIYTGEHFYLGTSTH